MEANKRERDEVLGAMREEQAGTVMVVGFQPPGDAGGSFETPPKQSMMSVYRHPVQCNIP
jgi:hypothetical protein